MMMYRYVLLLNHEQRTKLEELVRAEVVKTTAAEGLSIEEAHLLVSIRNKLESAPYMWTG